VTDDSKIAGSMNVATRNLKWTLIGVAKRHADPQSAARAIEEPTRRIKCP
jgi:hypothetical protein